VLWKILNKKLQIMNLKKIMDLQMEIYINDEDNALIDKLKRDSAIERSDNEEKK
jgi:hypothetical protein